MTSNSGNSTRLTTKYTYNYNTPNPTSMFDQLGNAAPISTTTYDYDGFDRLRSVINQQGIVSYGYDQLNRRSFMDFGPGNQDVSLNKHVAYDYDGLSRPLHVTNNFVQNIYPVGTVSQQLDYNYVGDRLQSLNYPNATHAQYCQTA